MKLIYNEDERMLADIATEFLESKSPVAAKRALRDQNSDLCFDPHIWQEMAQLGWSGISFAETFGGHGFSHKGLAAIFEAIGNNLTHSPMLSSVVICGGILQQLAKTNDLSEQHISWLEQIISGDKRIALALEEGVRHNPDHITTTAVKVDGGYRLSGDKVMVIDGYGADALLIVARINDITAPISLFLVPNDGRFSHKKMSVIDSGNYTSVKFEQTLIDDESLLTSTLVSAKVNAAKAALDVGLALGRLCLAAEMLGASSTLFNMTIDYLKTREQFDTKIGTFQALQHRAAKCFIELELTRSAVISGFVMADKLHSLFPEQLDDSVALLQVIDDISAAASLAKWKAGQLSDMISGEAVQMHGGIGVTDELDVGLYLKRIRVAQMSLGDSDFHLTQYADLTA
ncbi:acyl-CoA dehydrogenase domain protein [Shewanella halifaxensis HAW-EB4]|uniref:Acyl-CoA dehydrogenase domain protein n=1 Tax=Shewanella halifaxensis (strain HAW-EB4) TaxID=458817 RepID=B0TTV7_SHEHH|nr:acyl-CoA dehydrogenase family protein [Shewanella halifaxensis]ABZ76675.1 acyl-CoA dehydrogenase domain protein [Shewanella halifaxensis HAW-EB4]